MICNAEAEGIVEHAAVEGEKQVGDSWTRDDSIQRGVANVAQVRGKQRER